jgi:hypothetical protein
MFRISLVLSIICFIILQMITVSLSPLRDRLIVQTESYLTSDIIHTLNEYKNADRNITGCTVYNTIASANISTFRENLSGYTVYEVDGAYANFMNIKMIKGRFIFDSDVQNERRYAVIEKDTAVQLFSTVDCIGRALEINGEEYLVLGVYKREKTFASFISAIDKNRIYIPHSYAHTATVITTLVKTKPGLSAVLESKIGADFKNILGAPVVVENLGLRVEWIYQLKALTSFILLFLVFLRFRKAWMWAVKSSYRKIRRDLEDYYFWEAMKLNIFGMALHAAVALAVAGILYYAASRLDFTILIPHETVPARLIDIQGFKTVLTDYIIKINTRQAVVSENHSLVKNLSAMAIILCGVLIVSFQAWLSRLGIRNNGKENTKQGIQEGTDI